MTKDRSIISNIYKELLKRKSHSTGLLSGDIGKAVFFLHYDKVNSFNYVNPQVKLLIDRIEREVCNWSSVYYSTGVVGTLSGLKILEMIDSTCSYSIDHSELIPYFLDILEKDFRQENYDFFHGALGIMFFFILFSCQNEVEQSIEHALLAGVRDAESIFWSSYNRKIFDNKYVNLGLAHGMASILSILARSYRTTGRKEDVRSTMNLIMKYYVANENGDHVLSVFPYGISDKEENRFSRMAWCYGDPGIGLAFLTAGVETGIIEFVEYGENILLRAAKRFDLKVNQVDNPFLCHGTSGVAIIYLNAYKMSKNKLFYDVAKYWHSRTLDFLEGCDWQSYPQGLLEGLTGIGLMLLSFEVNENLEWEKLLLLN